MRFLRKRFVSKFLAVLLILLIVESTVHSSITYALTTGPHQPEYTSYEEPGAKDMVNLLTGDFSFSLPILDVPGPEGGFSVPLTYNAGIGLEQEASWVGLGWTLNVGAITRNIIQYPDDANGEIQLVTMKDLVGVRGWTSNALGLGQMGWSNTQGHYGALSLLSIVNVSYDNSGSTVGVVGINFGKNAGFDPVQFALAAVTIASLGVGAAGVTAGKVAVRAAVSIAESAALSYVSGNQTPNAPTDGAWTYSKRTSSFLGIWEDYWIWLDQTRYEYMRGILNFDNASIVKSGRMIGYDLDIGSVNYNINGVTTPYSIFEKYGQNRGIASDIVYNTPPSSHYKDAVSPVMLGTDNYSVKAPGISGSIKPYRFDVRTVAMPREMDKYHAMLAIGGYPSYKVPFIYEGSAANNYYYHVGGATAVSEPKFYNGITTLNGNDADVYKNDALTYVFNDVILQNKVRNDVATTAKLPMANHVEWLSNNEIIANSQPNFMDLFSGTDRTQFRQLYSFGVVKSLQASSDDFTDGKIYLQSEEVTNFSVNQPLTVNVNAYDASYDWLANTGIVTSHSFSTTVTEVINAGITGSSYITVNTSTFSTLIAGKYCDISITLNIGSPKKPTAIGGYSITGVNGLTYHFALPTYDYLNYTRIQDSNNRTTKYSEIKRDEPFASTWLLTGITGSDFVDRNGNGAIDIGDWGYWVRFNYGKHSNDYQWRVPFSDFNSTGGSETMSTGYHEMYYLNSIETRSNVALFIKDNRHDNKGKNAGGITNSGSSLRLSEIALLTREAYQKLFLPIAQGGFGMPSDVGLANIGRYWLFSDFYSTSGTSHPAQGNFIIQNAIKRIKFNYTYDLCPNTLNSIAPNRGKLTLTSLSLIGRNETRLVPDHKFEYGSNQGYGIYNWDGWGMYNGNGNSSSLSHTASSSDVEGAAWSLTKITNPLGSTIEVAYERDTYGSISGQYKLADGLNYQSSSTNAYPYIYSIGTTNGSILPVTSAMASQFVIGDMVQISGFANSACAASPYSYSGTYTIQDVTSNSIRLGPNFRSMPDCPQGQGPRLVNITSESGYLNKVLKNAKGGNTRVASIKLKDNGVEYKTRYLYNGDGGFSSGVVAREPEYIKTQDFDFYKFPNYPFTPVMYARVTVLTGKLTTDSDYATKQVYEFETPNSNMMWDSGTSEPNYRLVRKRGPQSFPIIGVKYSESFVKKVNNQINDYTAKIGKLKSVKTFSYGSATPTSSTEMFYTSQIENTGVSFNSTLNNYQGIFSEGSLLIDRMAEFGGASSPNTLYEYNKITRSTTLKYPYELKKVVTTKDGLTTETENIAWDFITGLVVEKTQKSPLGVKTKSVTKLAYTVPAYAEMGSKAINPNNKNMLGHDAANYTYLLDATGNSVGLLGASVQTYKSNWDNYRFFNGTQYTDGVDGSPNVWRKHQNYVYKGSFSDLRTDGSLTFSPAKEFNFAAGATNSGWQKVGEATRFDHYSASLEGRDLNGIYSSSKKDIEGKVMVASASNAAYTEFAYSGAEDWSSSSTGTYLGGEVAKGNGTPVYKNTGNEVHTGNVALQLSSGKGFVFTTGILRNFKTYRASVWTNSAQGRLYFGVNGIETSSQAPQATKKISNWYLLEMEMRTDDIVNPVFEVGVKTADGSVVYFDDFRFQPTEAAVVANVYDPITEQLTHTLDNQNMFTKYEYNEKGQLVRTYQETFGYGVKLVSEKKVNYRRDFIDR